MITTMQKEKVDAATTVLPHGIELDENGKVVGSCTMEELFDRLDEEFIAFYGEYGRKIVNRSRMKWNKDGIGNFKLF